MDVKSIKLEIVQKILEVEEEEVLQQIKVLLDASQQDWWDIISNEEKMAIHEGSMQLDKNEGVPHNEVIQELKKKFKLK